MSIYLLLLTEMKELHYIVSASKQLINKIICSQFFMQRNLKTQKIHVYTEQSTYHRLRKK